MLQWLADRGPGFVSADYSVWQVNVLPVPVQVLLWELPLCVMVHPGISWKLKFEFPVGIKKKIVFPCFSWYTPNPTSKFRGIWNAALRCRHTLCIGHFMGCRKDDHAITSIYARY